MINIQDTMNKFMKEMIKMKFYKTKEQARVMIGQLFAVGNLSAEHMSELNVQIDENYSEEPTE